MAETSSRTLASSADGFVPKRTWLAKRAYGNLLEDSESDEELIGGEPTATSPKRQRVEDGSDLGAARATEKEIDDQLMTPKPDDEGKSLQF